MIRFDRIIKAESLDVTIDVRNNIQMTSVNKKSGGSSKKIIEIIGDP